MTRPKMPSIELDAADAATIIEPIPTPEETIQELAADGYRILEATSAPGVISGKGRYKSLLAENPHLPAEDEIPDYHAPINGKPSSLCNPDIYHGIIKSIKDGNYVSVAAAAAGIEVHSINRWLERGRDGVDKLHYCFWLDVRRAEAEGERRRVESIANNPDWRAQMELLARRWPERWAKRDERQLTITANVVNTKRTEFAQVVMDDEGTRDLVRQLVNKTPALLQEAENAAFTEVPDED